MEPKLIQLVTTTETEKDACRIAAELVERRLVACAQIAGPITSVYRWKGQVETSREYQCKAKCRREQFDQVASAIRAMHPYEVPQIIALPIVAVTADYEAWAIMETQLD